MEQEAAERLKAMEPWRITDNELELYKAKVKHSKTVLLTATSFLHWLTVNNTQSVWCHMTHDK